MGRSIQDTGPAVAVLAMGLAAAAASFWIPLEHDGSWAPRAFPLMSAGALVLLGGLMLRPGPGSGVGATAGAIPRGPFALLALVVLYLWLIGKLGYLVATGLVTPAALWLFGIRNPLGLAVAALAAPAIFHTIFFGLLGVFPPHGAWFDLLDLIGG